MTTPGGGLPPGLMVIGLSHRTAPIEVRERLTWPERDVPQVVADLAAAGGGPGGVALLTTCNRTEFYLVDPVSPVVDEIWNRAAARIGQPADQYAYVLRGRDAAR